MILHYLNSNKNLKKTLDLESKMGEFYTTNTAYYDEINFAASNWQHSSEKSYQRILELCSNKRVAEVGCGEAAILDVVSSSSSSLDYTGCDFSKELIERNSQKYAQAKFEVILDPSKLPLEDESYDLVFCVFVLEHVVRPKVFLGELSRCCKKGGKVVIFCPDYGGRLGMASQVVGFSNGSGMNKIRKGRIIDGLLTGLVNKLLMPLFLKFQLRNAENKPVFLLNFKPACFCRPFYPDADAVYVTHRGEILKTLRDLGFEINENSKELVEYNRQLKTIFVEATRV